MRNSKKKAVSLLLDGVNGCATNSMPRRSGDKEPNKTFLMSQNSIREQKHKPLIYKYLLSFV
ncbi:hypothetical protein FORC54_3128 [Vibrio vulnificus]|nr:hypothetical protein FORC54_3128 [Vibrio vulnificus]